jgi:hypothetical protein
MDYRLRCYTLFDITVTNIRNRGRPENPDLLEDWLYKRNTQCNFDTILQAISLRSQPDVFSNPKRNDIRFDEFTQFGFLFDQEEEELYPCWSFEFSVQHPSVFYDGITELGSLYKDCDQVPMIKTYTSWDKLSSCLDTSDELKNIYFEVLNGN